MIGIVKRVGVYVGSFDPFHVGHLYVAKEAARLFDEVRIVRAVNPLKVDRQFPFPQERLKDYGFTTLDHYGVVTDLFRLNGTASDMERRVMIRGLRNGFDLQYETNYRKWVNEFDPNIQFVYICCPADLEHISSSEIKVAQKFSPEIADRYIVKDDVK
jgi:pantetheine-phosphate adenylyltransferase